MQVILAGTTIALAAIPLTTVLQSKESPPEVVAGVDNITFELPEKPVNHTIFGFKFQRKIVEMEIRLAEAENANAPIHLCQDDPSKPVPVKTSRSCKYKYRTREAYAMWSKWSKEMYSSLRRPALSIPRTLSERDRLDLENSIKTAEPRKILVLGKIHTGKSSFINTLFTAFNQGWIEPALTSPTDRSVTADKKGYELVTNRIIIYDLPGWERNFDFRLVNDLVQGKCGNLTIENMKNGEFEKSTNPENFKIDVALIFVGADHTEEDKEINQKLVKQLLNSKIPSVVVLTKVDKLPKHGEEGIDECNFHSDPRVLQCCKELRESLCNHVIPIINYTEYRENIAPIDYAALKILNIALSM